MDTVSYTLVDLPPVLLGRARDLTSALAKAKLRNALRDPKGAAASAGQTTLDVLGGGFVKLAQVVAHSPALFPPAFVEACRNSLANAATPPALPAEVMRLLASELGGVTAVKDLFKAFDPVPIASASIAQVHKAKLKSGEKCVVKIVRPKVKERIAADFQALLLLARAVDLVLGEEVILQFVNSPLELCVDELRRAIMDECNLNLERQNMHDFRDWVLASKALQRSGLADSVYVPEVYERACSSRVLTMEFVEGRTLSEVYTSKKKAGDWQDALTRALTVASLSIVDGPALFHADLHSGNMIMMPGHSGALEQVAFIDFGCCGRLPPALRSCLFMQASAFAGSQPNVQQFTSGFAHALQRIPGLGPDDLDVHGLARELTPLLAELDRLNPFGPNANPMDVELHALLFRLQMSLYNFGVQLPREFTLLMKTACFGTLYFAMLDDLHRKQLQSHLVQAGACYISCNPGEVRHLLAPSTLVAILKLAKSQSKGKLLPKGKVTVPGIADRATVAACAAASLPLMVFTMRYLV
jgi:predicted unusual protein kinase regulating ubiquinone biosynthesis (AarF/ABC1/UbiB family)